MNTPKKIRPKGWLKNPKIARENELIGGGFFIFRRGDDTKRIRPAMWPFEYPTEEAARTQADNLAKQNPGDKFEVFGHCYTAPIETDHMSEAEFQEFAGAAQ